MIKFWTQEEESEKLRERFKDLKAEKNIGQAEFARANDVPGGPSLLSQHIKNRRPINLEAAKAYAKGFGCSIAEISPRLGKELDDAYEVSGSAEPRRLSWAPKQDPEYLEMFADDLKKSAPVPGYSQEGLTLAWLLDQIKDRLDKKRAESEASAVILRYVNMIDQSPTDKPVER